MNCANTKMTGGGVIGRFGRLTAAALCLSLTVPAAADTLTLRTGATVEGMILEESETSVTFQDLAGVVLRLPKSTITDIDRGISPLQYQKMGDTAFEGKEYEEAIGHWQAAMEGLENDAALQQKIAVARAALERAVLGEFADDVQRIRDLAEQGRLDEAEQGIRNLGGEAQENPHLMSALRKSLANVHVRRAANYADVVNYADAIEELRAALRIEPANARTHLELARLCEQSTRTRDDAIRHYVKALEYAEGDLTREEVLSTNLKAADLYAAKGDHNSAVPYYQFVFEEDAEFRRNLTDSFIDSLTALADSDDVGELEEAIASLRKAAAARPDSEEVHAYLAELLLDSDRYDEAIESYLRLLQIAPEHRGANAAIADAYLAKQDLLNARDYLEREVELYPNSYERWCDLGDLHWRLGDYEAAQEAFATARRIDPEEPRALVALAAADRRLGNFEEARDSIEQILDRFPTNIRANLEMGLILTEMQDYDDAEEYLDRAVELVEQTGIESSNEGRTLLADAFLGKGTIALLDAGPGTATRQFNRALEVLPGYSSAHFSIGNAYVKKFSSSKSLDDLMEAEKEMMRAREIDPQNPEYALGLGVLYQQVLAVEDRERRSDYEQKAIEQYRDYVRNGGAQVEQVTAWIRELGGA